LFSRRHGRLLVFVPPVDNFVGWGDAKNGNRASVDYAGLANRWIETESGGAVSFGTTFSGVVLEHLLRDGRADVTVTLRTDNALIFVTQMDFATGPLVFGRRAPDVLVTDAQPVLAHTTFHISFTNIAPGAPLPDLIQLFFAPLAGQAIENYSFAEAHDGSASATVTQTGNAARSNIQAAVVMVRASKPD
jgi:hypothetical protein